MGSRDGSFHQSPAQITESLTLGGRGLLHSNMSTFCLWQKASILVWQDLAIWMSLLDLFLGLRLLSQSSWLNAFVSWVPFYIPSLLLSHWDLSSHISKTISGIFLPFSSSRVFVPCVISVPSESLFRLFWSPSVVFELYSGLWQSSTAG